MNFASLLIGLLTIALVLNSLLLILLVLIQLPKKEAGLGMAFGGSAADALFGAGSGTVISRWTKYGAASFLILSLVLAVMRNHQARATGRTIASELERQSPPAVTTPATPLTLTNPAPAVPPLPGAGTSPDAAAPNPAPPPTPAPAQ